MRVDSTITSARTGFSIVEVLVSLVLITLGLLAVAGGESIAVRMSDSAARERRGAQRAADRLARLTSQNCTTARSGSLTDLDSAFSERWTVGSPVNGAALVDAQVSWTTRRGTRTMVLHGVSLC